jgi:hypothetical protein
VLELKINVISMNEFKLKKYRLLTNKAEWLLKISYGVRTRDDLVDAINRETAAEFLEYEAEEMSSYEECSCCGDLSNLKDGMCPSCYAEIVFDGSLIDMDDNDLPF